MKRYRDADEAFWDMVELRERLSAPRAADLVETRGMRWAAVCPNSRCSSTAHHESWSARYGHRELCRSCGATWPGEEEVEPRGKPKSSARLAPMESLLADLGTLRLVFAKLGLWEGRAYGLVMGEQLTLREAAARAAQLWPRAPFRWNPTKVFRLVGAARARAESDLASRRLLDRAVKVRNHEGGRR